MKTYEVEGHYNGKVILRVKAAGIADAARIFTVEGGEDSVEIVNPSSITVDENTLRVVR